TRSGGRGALRGGGPGGGGVRHRSLSARRDHLVAGSGDPSLSALITGASSILAAASHAATSPRAGGGFHFDPATTLGWAVPLIILAPLGAFVIAISSVRTRLAATNTTLLGVAVSLAASLLVGWGLAGKTSPYIASYVYLNSNVAFTGPTNFENFEVDIAFRVDHLTILAIALINVCIAIVLRWNRFVGRNE